MKKVSKEIRDKTVIARMNEEELARFTTFFNESTCRSKSEYLRKICLQKPVVIKYRNQSADDLLSVLVGLKKELHAIGNNYNQAVHQLHTLDHVPQIKTWLTIHDPLHQAFHRKVEEIKIRMNQIYESWSHK